MENPTSKRDVLDMLLTHVNRTLLVFKLYYFFYFAAFGSLFPLISVYFKQLGLSATQCGILVGCRPFVEFISAPFWGVIAERWKKGKLLILISLICGLLFTVGIGFTRPIPEGCLLKGKFPNETIIKEPGDYGNQPQLLVSDPKILYPKLMGQSPIRLVDQNILMELNAESGNFVIPVYSPIVYTTENIYQTFVILLVLLILGEFMSSPSLALADTAVLNYLKEDRENYGRQRLYGSVGWGLAMFCIGISLDQAIKFHNHPCGWPGEREKNYVICFTIFSVFMCFSLITATQMTFTYDDQSENMYFKVVKDKVSQTILGGKTKNRQHLINEPDDSEINRRKDDEILEQQLSIKLDKTNYQSKSEDPYEDNYQINNFDLNVWVGALKTFKSIRLISLLFLAWFMGFGVGIVFTFLFWHLQDIKGSPTLFGIASVFNHISEILAYFFSGKLIASIGHTKVLYLGLLGNVVRFLYVSWIQNSWWILPFEMIQGLTHAAVWSACYSYMAQTTPKEYRNASQRILQGIHHGLGKGCGSIFGGMIIGSFGTPVLFRAYGIMCCFVLIGFLTINYFLAEISPTDPIKSVPNQSNFENSAPHEYYSGYDQPADSTTYVEEETFMSPHGIPFMPNNEYRNTENYNAIKGNSNQAAFRPF